MVVLPLSVIDRLNPRRRRTFCRQQLLKLNPLTTWVGQSIMLAVASGVVLLVITYLIVDKVLRAMTVGNYGNKYVFVTGCDSGFGQRLAV